MSDHWGKCACGGWGVRGERPDVTFCECRDGQSLARDIPNYLEIANRMPKGAGVESLARKQKPATSADKDNYQGEF